MPCNHALTPILKRQRTPLPKEDIARHDVVEEAKDIQESHPAYLVIRQGSLISSQSLITPTIPVVF